jgi:hypothetical protein
LERSTDDKIGKSAIQLKQQSLAEMGMFMPRISSWIVFGLMSAAPVLVAQNTGQPAAQPSAPDAKPSAAQASPATPARPGSTAASSATAKHRKPHKVEPPPPIVLPPLPSGPLSQLPMDQIPSTPAKVSYQGGLLTISAQNSTLGEILRDVRKLTGASIEIPPGSKGASERVVAHLGPGSPRDVLVGLFNGSSFNYVILGSSSDPKIVSSVILTSKDGGGQPGQTQTAANGFQGNPGALQNRFPAPHPFNPQAVTPMPGNGVPEPEAAESDDATEEAQDTTEENADDQAQAGQPVPPDPSAGNANGQQAQTDPNQPNAGPKTPEQVLEMLRRSQQPGGAVNPQQPGITSPPTPPDQE